MVVTRTMLTETKVGHGAMNRIYIRLLQGPTLMQAMRHLDEARELPQGCTDTH